MARTSRKENASGSVASTGGLASKVDAAARIARAPARNRSDRGLVKNRRRIYRRALGAGGIARRHTLRSSPPTSFALRARTNFQDRDLAKTEKTLWRQNDP